MQLSSTDHLVSLSSNGLISAVAQIAQSVEQGIENPRVGGSIPPPGTITSFKNLVFPS